jgi:hypothetical protein
MDEDLIAGNFADNINKRVIQRNIKLLRVSLVFLSIYSLLTAIQWYTMIVKSITFTQTSLVIILYRIAPAVFLITTILTLYTWVLYMKGNRLILLSFEKDNADLFNEGYYAFSKAAILNIIGFGAVILLTLVEIIFK